MRILYFIGIIFIIISVTITSKTIIYNIGIIFEHSMHHFPFLPYNKPYCAVINIK